MGKANKVKREMIEVRDLVELVQVLKDIADMKFRDLFARRGGFQRFGESFAEFFRLLEYTEIAHPLVANTNPNVCIVVITSEEGFIGDLNNKVIVRALDERDKHPDAQFVTVGRKGVMKLAMMGVKNTRTFEEIAECGMYETSVMLKDYLVEQVLTGKIGKVLVVYPWPKDLQTVKARVVKLLPCEFIFQKQKQKVEQFTHVIEESDPLDVIGYLANLWTSTKIYEMMFDTSIAAVSAQSQQLDTSLTNVKKEGQLYKMKYRKARKNDIDKSLREVFSSRMMSVSK
ncbi:MAG: F0F1 ATP synthase subunit gamma [Candidatus Omnitrophica bacterium]|nr:F0F1 ATP synthase subunit gamma [Candidatus Omnitrophota bacterium]